MQFLSLSLYWLQTENSGTASTPTVLGSIIGFLLLVDALFAVVYGYRRNSAVAIALGVIFSGIIPGLFLLLILYVADDKSRNRRSQKTRTPRKPRSPRTSSKR